MLLFKSPGTQSGRRRKKRQSEKKNKNKKTSHGQRRNDTQTDLILDLNVEETSTNANVSGNSFDSIQALFRKFQNLIYRLLGKIFLIS